eukprot:2997283-Rhodomonas_salina.1
MPSHHPTQLHCKLKYKKPPSCVDARLGSERSAQVPAELKAPGAVKLTGHPHRQVATRRGMSHLTAETLGGEEQG